MAWSLFAVLATEALSMPGWLTARGLALAWLALDIVLIASLVHQLGSLARPGARPRSPDTSATRWAALIRVITPTATIHASVLRAGAIAAVSLLVAVVGLVALVSPPNTWDAMQYHLPRIVHWLQNRSVAFYPTHDLRQLHMAPGAEFLVLQWHALAASDRLDNLVQWFAFAASAVGVSLIAGSLGATARGQTLAALICATIPQGILYASATKNDWVLSLWLVALSYYFLRLKQDPTWPNTLGASVALALACLTKTTAYVLIAPMLLVWLAMVQRSVARTLIKRLPVVILIILVVTGSHFARNYDLYGSPLGPPAENPSGQYKYTNDRFSPSTVLSNVVRNVALHLAILSAKTSGALERWIVRGLDGLRIDAHDPATTWTGHRFAIPPRSRHEALAGNPLHVALILLTLVTLLSKRSRRDDKDTPTYTLGLLLAFLAFCALLKWQPWHTRLHLPLFVLWSAPIAVVAETRYPRLAVYGLAATLLFLSSPAVLRNDLRPLLGRASIVRRDRTDLYFAERPELKDSYVAAAARVRARGCRRIALELPGYVAPYEYPLLVLLGGGYDAEGRLVGITNPSRKYAHVDALFSPCAVLCVDCTPPPEGTPRTSTIVISFPKQR